MSKHVGECRDHAPSVDGYCDLAAAGQNRRTESKFDEIAPSYASEAPSILLSVSGDDTPRSTLSDRAPPQQQQPGAQLTRGPPVVHKWNVLPCILFVLFCLISGYYFYIRLQTLTSSYAIFILGAELMGMSSFMPYAILLCRGVFPTGSPGLPAVTSEEQSQEEDSDADPRFCVRVLIPCYKEPIDVISGTVVAALEALLPAGTQRTVYLLDDGNSPDKQAFIESFGSDQVQYISGRVRTAGQVNGKSENLNNALRNHIFKQHINASPTNVNSATLSPATAAACNNLSAMHIPARELIVVFDADMRANPDFFLKTLEVMADETCQLCLTPQAFHNILPENDLFNNINKQFWEYWLPGAFAWGYIACTGTNFVLRARALASCGWFPNNTITEDYALGMELNKRRYKATYLMQYVAVGEAPDEARNVFQQRSRWTKGHYQVFFSWSNPLFNTGLPFVQRLWYCYAAWAPFCNTVTAPIFFLVPFMSIVFGFHPVSLSFDYVLAATLLLISINSVQYYVRDLDDLRSMWYVNISNTVLWFTHTKAFFNTLIARIRNKALTFKVTTKNKGSEEGATTALLHAKPIRSDKLQMSRPRTVPQEDSPQKRLLSKIQQQPSRQSVMSDSLPSPGSLADLQMQRPLWSPTANMAVWEDSATPSTALNNSPSSWGGYANGENRGLKPIMTNRTSELKGGDYGGPGSPANMATLRARTSHKILNDPTDTTPQYNDETMMRVLPTPRVGASAAVDGLATKKATLFSRTGRLMTMLRSYKPAHVQDFGQMMDPLALFIIFVFCILTGCLGISELVNGSKPGAGGAAITFLLGSPMVGSPYIVIATLWAFYNAVAPYLFLHYCASTGPSFRFMAKWLCVLSNLLMIGSLVFIWLVIPAMVKPQDALSLSLKNLYPKSIARDTNTNFFVVAGLDEIPINVTGLSLNLTGGLLTSDHVKNSMTLSYTLTMLSWALLQFPSAFKGKEGPVLDTLRAGADYLIKCDLNSSSNDNPLFVAQVGNGADYLVLQDPGFDPVSEGKVWTSPWQDPQLVGGDTRKVWVMTRDHIGADLLSDAAAALAAVSMVFKDRDAKFSFAALWQSKRLYRFATSRDHSPQSYCDFVPCTTNVSVSSQVVTRPYIENNATSITSDPECYYIEWITKTCRIGNTVRACVNQKAINQDVFLGRMDCCNTLYNPNVSTTLPQGICAVPAGQFQCYVPDAAQRTCLQQGIDPVSGVGCAGKGLSIYPDSLSCCESLTSSGAIEPDAGKAGVGMCSRAGLDSSFTKCWVPSVSMGTCLEKSATECVGFGLETSYDTSIACCNRLLDLVASGSGATSTPGGFTVTPTGICSAPTKVGRRALLQEVAKVEAIKTWTIPILDQSTLCVDGSCDLQQITKVVEVPLYNSSSVLDDMAWGGIWLYKATGDPAYLGQSQRYLGRHYTEDISFDTLYNDRSYYISDWNNVAWATNVLLSQATEESIYRERMAILFKAWVYGGSVFPSEYVIPPTVRTEKFNPANPSLDNFTDPATRQIYQIIPECYPTATYEENCFDGKDDDCNGLTDRFDVACGLFPIQYTPRNLAFTSSPSLPNAANTAFLSLVYSDLLDKKQSTQLQCWSLGQATYMLGGKQGVNSYVVGFGENSPKVVQHRASSCALGATGANLTQAGAPICSWDSGFFPGIANPNLDVVKGALVWGPSDWSDNYAGTSRRSDDTRVRLEDNVGFTGMLAGLGSHDVTINKCFLEHGIWQRYVATDGTI